MGWHVESVFKEIASEALGARFIQKKSKNDIGDFLKKLMELRREDINGNINENEED